MKADLASMANVTASLAPEILRIRPPRGWAGVNLRELWAFRDLFVILASRDVRLRYKQTALGVIWVLLQPLLASGIFSLIFGRLAHLPSDQAPYLLFVYAGILPWTLFSGAVQRASSSIVADSKLIQKVYFPRIVIPVASAAAVLVDFVITFVVVAVLLAVFRIAPTWNLLAVIPLTLVTFAISVGVGLWLSALNVYYRDFVYALPFLLQIWMYASPLVYSVTLVPRQWLGLYGLNPVVGVIDGFRWAIIGTGPFPAITLTASVSVGMLALMSGVAVFRRIERNFADVI
jgi:lipopolysaccharide transport system permease protein